MSYSVSVLRTAYSVHIIHTDTGGFNGTYRFLHNAFLIRLVCPRLQFRGSHEAAMADARTQIGKSLCALTGRDSDAWVDTWDLGLAPIGLPKPNSHQHPPSLQGSQIFRCSPDPKSAICHSSEIWAERLDN